MSQGQRRLAAIMFTDMVGYTALGQRNESLSLALVQEQRKLVRPILKRHNGREVKTMGDAFLVEFSSALDAVRCAYDVQRATREFNISVPEDRKIHLRIGIHVGDVVDSRGDVSGDAVSVASRIEPLAEEGGVCLTRQVYDHIQNKFELQLTSLGIKPLKNVGVPVEVYKIVMPWSEEREEKKEKTVSVTQPSRTRVAVLPFENISPDPADGYFADGMTVELIDRLSQVKELRVIARTSVMSYKTKEKKASEIGKELGVGSLVEGNVRKIGNKIRVTAQLIDAGTEEHVWSSRYDKDLDDIFDVQTDIASKITTALAGALAAQQNPGISESHTSNLTAYQYFLQARQLENEFTKDSLARALKFMEMAVELDPSFARVYAEMAWCIDAFPDFGLLSREEALRKAKSAAQRALNLNPNLSEAHQVLAEHALWENENATAEMEARKAVELNPNNSNAYFVLGAARARKGYPIEAITLFQTAHLLDPVSPWTIDLLGSLYLYCGREAEAQALWARNLQVAREVALHGITNSNLVKRDYEKAEETLRTLEKDFPEGVATVGLRGELEALKGNKEGAKCAIEILSTKYKTAYGSDNRISFIKYLLGDKDGFFAEMFRAIENRSLPAFRLRYSALFEEARGDPRYRDVMARSGLDPDTKDGPL